MSARLVVRPWNDATVAALNAHQRDPNQHPYTCGSDRGNRYHVMSAALNGDHDLGILEATKNGWRCPTCGYSQSWALDPH